MIRQNWQGQRTRLCEETQRTCVRRITLVFSVQTYHKRQSALCLYPQDPMGVSPHSGTPTGVGHHRALFTYQQNLMINGTGILQGWLSTAHHICSWSLSLLSSLVVWQWDDGKSIVYALEAVRPLYTVILVQIRSCVTTTQECVQACSVRITQSCWMTLNRSVYSQ